MPVDRPWRARGVCRRRRRRRPPRGTQLLPAGCRRNGGTGRHVIIRHQGAEYSRTDVFFPLPYVRHGPRAPAGRHFGRRGLRGRGRRGPSGFTGVNAVVGASACSAAGVNATVGASAAEYKGTGRGPRLPRPGRRAFHRRIVEIKHKRRRLGHRLRGARRLRRLFTAAGAAGRHSGDRLLHRPEYPAAAACSHPVARQQKPARAGRAFLPEFRNRTRPLRNCRRRRPGCGTLHRRIVEIEHERSRLGRAGRARRLHRLYSRPRAAQQQWVPHRPENPETAARSRPAVRRQEPARAFLPECRNQTRLSGRSCGRRRPGCGTLHRRIVKIEHERSRLGRSLRRRDRPNGCIIRPSEGSGRRRGNARFRHAAERRGGQALHRTRRARAGRAAPARRSRRALEGKNRRKGLRGPSLRDGGIILRPGNRNPASGIPANGSSSAGCFSTGCCAGDVFSPVHPQAQSPGRKRSPS